MGHYVDRVRLVTDLVNSIDVFAGEEHLNTPDDLLEFAGEHGVGGGDVAREDLDRLRTARAALRSALTSDNEVYAVDAVNEVMAGARPRPRLEPDQDGGWTFAFADPAASLVERLLAEAAAGALEEIQRHGTSRFSTCASTTCEDLFLDHSRNHSRRYCSPEVCGNREAQRAYRARQAERSD